MKQNFPYLLLALVNWLAVVLFLILQGHCIFSRTHQSSTRVLQVFQRQDGEALPNYTMRVQGMYCENLRMCGVKPDTSLTGIEKPVIDVSCYDKLCREGGCYCDQRCSIYGDCCPNAKQFSEDMDASVCSHLNIKGVAELQLSEKSYALISNCHKDFADMELRAKCHSPDKLKARYIETQIPVTVSELSLTYKNKYCAECHGYTDYKMWKFRIVCTRFLKLPSYKSKNELLDLFMDSEECDFQLIPRVKLKDLRQCSSLTDITSECKVSTDSRFNEMCSLYTTIFLNKYRNVFCFLCNGRVNVEASDNCQSTYNNREERLYPSFSYEMNGNFESTVGVDNDTCQRGFRYDHYKKVCRELHCTLGKWLLADQCEAVIQLKGIYSFETTVVYAISTSNRHDDSNAPGDVAFVPRKYSYFLKTVSFVKSFIYMDDDVRRFCEDCENTAAAYTFTIQIVRQTGYIETFEKTINELKKESHFLVFMDFGNVVLIPNEDLTALYVADDASLSNISSSYIWIDKENEKVRKSKKDYYLPSIKIGQFNVCPTVRLNLSEVDQYQHALFVPALESIVLPGQYSLLNASEVIMCAEFYFSSLINRSENSPVSRMTFETTANYETTEVGSTSTVNSSKRTRANKILRIVAQSLSTVGLLIICIGYCAERALLTPPGVKTFVFSICLIFAQNLYVFGFDQTENELICKGIAIATHFVWLAAAAIINAGCFYMFRVFGSLLNAEKPKPDTKLELIFWLCYAFTIPSIGVLINICSSLLSHGDIGYSRHECFISYSSIFLYSFIIPLGILLVANIILCSVILISIRSMPGIQKIAKADRIYTVMYLVVSILMAATWASGSAYEITLNVYTSYVFEALDCTLGLVFFAIFYGNINALKTSGRRRKLYMAAENPPKVSTEETEQSDLNSTEMKSKDLMTNLK